jgi:hypothetical protein
MPRSIWLGALIGFIIIILFAIFFDLFGLLIGGLVGGIVAGAIAIGLGRGTLAGFLAGVIGLVIVAILASIGYYFVGVNGIALSSDFLDGLTGQAIYIAKAAFVTVFSVVGGYIGGFFSQISSLNQQETIDRPRA